LNTNLDVKNEKTTESEDIVDKENTSSIDNPKINQTEFDNAWKELLEKFKKQQRLYAALKANQPVLLNDNEAALKVSNKSLEQALIKLKSRILNFLRSKLNHTEFELKISVETNDEEDSNFLYTDRDKYKYLVKKNPNLEDLKNSLGLDF